MTTTIEAIYDHGVLRLKNPIELDDGAIVEVTITTREPSAQSANPAHLLSEIAALPLEGDTDELSGRDHDKILYGEKIQR